MTMTLDDVLEQSGVMLGVGKLPTADQLIAWRDAIALYLAAVREVIAEMNAPLAPASWPVRWRDMLEAAIATQTKEPSQTGKVESRLAEADALLLRYCVQIGELSKGLDPHDPIFVDLQRLGADYMAHLQGAGDE